MAQLQPPRESRRMMGNVEQKLAAIDDLHKIYAAGNLRILAGAGISIQSRLPDWERLNRSLLQSHLSETLSSVAAQHVDTAALADTFTGEVYERLGREAVAELILRSNEPRFVESLARALYQGRRLNELYLSDLQMQIASLMIAPAHPGRLGWYRCGRRPARLFTTNFDSLLEMALARTCIDHQIAAVDRDPLVTFRLFRTPQGATDVPVRADFPQVVHLHGWVDPDGQSGGQIVYTESHYVSLQSERDADANVAAGDLLSKAGATVILGMSLTDPNLRRLLYSRSWQRLSNSAASVYYFLRQVDRALASAYEAKFWEQLKVKLVPFGSYSDLPDLMRQVQWGVAAANAAPGWFQTSAAFSGIQPDARDRWYQLASKLLVVIHEQIGHMYLTRARESIRVTFWTTLAGANGKFEPRISELGSVDKEGRFEAGSTQELFASAEQRSLDIRTGKVQGLAGVSFFTGAMKEGVTGDGSSAIDFQFTPEMRRAFDRGSYRDWRSMLAVPILGGPYWLPLGVMCVHSNFEEPFWKGLQQKPTAFEDFRQVLLKAGSELLIHAQRR